MMLQIQHQTPDQQLILEQAPVPEISPGQVLVKVTAFGLNRADTLQRQGKYPPPPGESPIMGLEVAGEVIEVAADVSRWHVGQRVFGLVAGGGYAQYVAVNADHLMAVPDAMTMNEAAGCAEVFLTAYQALFSLGQLKNHQKVLLHAGASGVGSAAIQLAQLVGAKVAVTASSDEKLAFCQQLGAELLINYKQSSFAEQIKTQWEGVDLIVDVVGGDYLNANVKSLNMDGRIVQLAMLGGRYVENFDMALMLAKRATLMASTLRNRSDEYKSQLIQGFVERFAEALAKRRLTVCIDSTFAASEIALAHQRLELNQSMGKLVCYWD
ncbi:NAD(P)H-quinone oxidoreductase [Bowmanella yangjiangensis]|uniref:NAD(P)H-quinone oxidoreductase n=1 Tax=Bowmanella yangjiangensis TaxID=2811230 RepID=A0ABS3D163_9ALTE|nr:NAD(P)H-quinone oxidoreductase [Bowmanella yangjiangensis]MBN7822106.1 NAD(P)H-quinone oxidoreductase [Bowmanella yangjiangensis]